MGIIMSPLKVYLTIALVELFLATCMADGYMQILVMSKTGTKYMLHVKPTDTFEWFKKMIADNEGISPEEHRLIFGGKALADGGRTVSLFPDDPKQISVVNTTGQRYMLQVNPTDTVEWLKQVIADIPEEYRLLLGGKLLTDGGRTVAYFQSTG